MGWHWLNDRPRQDQIQLKIKQRWFRDTAEFFYFAGLPYGALVWGIITPQALGLKGLENFTLISATSFWADLQTAFTLLLVESLLDLSPMLGAGLAALLVMGATALILTHYGVDIPWPGAQTIIYHTLHWAFYWALFWNITQDQYLGIILGVGWIILEWFLVACIKRQQLIYQPQYLVELMILMPAAALFFYWANLWLLWLLLPALVWIVKIINVRSQRL